MEIKVTVTGLAELADSIALLAAAMGGSGIVGVVPIDVKKVEAQMADPKQEKPPIQPKQDKPKAEPKDKPAPPKDKAKAESAPELEETKEPEQTAPEETSGKEYTHAEVRAKLGEISDSGKAAEVKAIINKYSTTGKLSGIDPEKFAEVMAEAGAL